MHKKYPDAEGGREKPLQTESPNTAAMVRKVWEGDKPETVR